MIKRLFAFALLGALVAAGGCTTTSSTSGDPKARAAAIDAGVDSMLSELSRQAPGSDQLVKNARGVLVFPAHGHTPGHAAVLVSSGRQQLLYIGDAVLHPAQIENPDWVSAFDLSVDDTVRTRTQLLERAAADRCLVAGFHLPGGIGAVQKEIGGYHWSLALPAMACGSDA